jgi:hypothetical protein
MTETKPVVRHKWTITPNIMRIELRFGDSTVMIVDEFPDLSVVSPLSLGGTDNTLTIHTDDMNALWQRALKAGAEAPSRCRMRSGATGTERSPTRSDTAGLSPNTSATSQPTR